MNSVDIHHLAAAYALDAVDDHERLVFEAHYESCDLCQVDVAEFRSTMAIMGEAQPIEPSEHVGLAVMRSIKETRQLSPVVLTRLVEESSKAQRPTFRTPRRVLAIAAALAMFAGVGAVVARVNRPTTNGFSAGLEQVVGRPDARVVTLANPGGITASGRITLLWSDDADRAVVIGQGIARPDSDKVYELWLIDGSGARPAGLLDTAADGSIRGSLPMSATPSAWAITVEPAGGSATPSGAPLFQATA